MTKKSVYFAVFILFMGGIISCEKDFQDIGTSVINNTKFDIGDSLVHIEITNKAIISVRGDGLALGGALEQYLLGVYNNPNYEKIEASIVSQITFQPGLKVVDGEYESNVTVITTIDTAYLKLPYQATLIDADAGTVAFELDSIIGDRTKAFTLNIYQSDTYLSQLNPQDPSTQNSYETNAIYQKIAGELNATPNYQFIPNANDTAIVIKRRLNNGVVYDTDTIVLENKNPFARIPLNEDKIKQLFLDKFGEDEFSSQVNFNNYFKGLYIEASGSEGSLISFNINNSTANLRPSIEVYYTNTVYQGGVAIDTIKKNDVFFMSNFSNSIYKMTEKTYPADKNIVIQGTAGDMAEIKLFGPDNNNNNIADQIVVFRQNNWLINEALLTVYVNQDIVQFDTLA
ncbi:MAG: DUF4270 family protein, partial [Flavobacteriaceae bacterium]|nr:DUF4270 family protein [Flavobacteriaceae bacterium]